MLYSIYLFRITVVQPPNPIRNWSIRSIQRDKKIPRSHPIRLTFRQVFGQTISCLTAAGISWSTKMGTQKMLRFYSISAWKREIFKHFFRGWGGLFEESKNVKEKHQNPLIRTGSVECTKQWTYLRITRKIEEPFVCRETPHESPTFFDFCTKNQIPKIKSRILEKRPEKKPPT